MKHLRNRKLLVLVAVLMLIVAAVPAYADPTAGGTSCQRWWSGSGDIHDYLWCYLITYADYYCQAITAW
jgi:hypothetical protein